MDTFPIKEAHKWASSFLKKNNIEFYELEAEILIRALYNWDKSQFFLNLDKTVSNDIREKLNYLLLRRINHEPIQYITGFQDFYGRKFLVNHDVLIPRPETELLVEAVLKKTNLRKESIKVVDIGTGSGAIAITLAKEKADFEVIAVDISDKALAIAKTNALSLGADVSFHHGDLLSPVIETGLKVDIIVSNPPYIPSNNIAFLMPEVKNYEPRIALDGGNDGLDYYHRIILQSKEVLREAGMIFFEVGIYQAEGIKKLLESSGAKRIKIINDYQNIERILIAEY